MSRRRLAVLSCAALGLLCSTAKAQSYKGGRSGNLADSGYPYPGEVSSEPLRIRVAPEVQATKLIHRVHAAYPPQAAAQKLTGQIVLHAIISTDGSIQRLDYVSGPKVFEKSAKDAVRLWLYRPTLVKGAPVEVDTTIRLTFLSAEPSQGAVQSNTAGTHEVSAAEGGQQDSTAADHPR